MFKRETCLQAYMGLRLKETIDTNPAHLDQIQFSAESIDFPEITLIFGYLKGKNYLLIS